LVLLVDLVDDNVVTGHVDQLLVVLDEETVLDIGAQTEEVFRHN
jgi:hypothetical protein